MGTVLPSVSSVPSLGIRNGQDLSPAGGVDRGLVGAALDESQPVTAWPVCHVLEQAQRGRSRGRSTPFGSATRDRRAVDDADAGQVAVVDLRLDVVLLVADEAGDGNGPVAAAMTCSMRVGSSSSSVASSSARAARSVTSHGSTTTTACDGMLIRSAAPATVARPVPRRSRVDADEGAARRQSDQVAANDARGGRAGRRDRASSPNGPACETRSCNMRPSRISSKPDVGICADRAVRLAHVERVRSGSIATRTYGPVSDGDLAVPAVRGRRRRRSCLSRRRACRRCAYSAWSVGLQRCSITASVAAAPRWQPR